MSGNPDVRGGASHDAYSPLPPRPNLEFERKRAKSLHREWTRRGEARQLSDAQFEIARTYGFASWPKLVAYYEMWARHVRSGSVLKFTRADYEQSVKWVHESVKKRSDLTALEMAAYLPRFFGLRHANIDDVTLTDDEARLIVARRARCATWSDLLARAAITQPDREREFNESPLFHALQAMERGDLVQFNEALEAHARLVDTHDPEGGVSDLALNSFTMAFRFHPEIPRAFSDALIARSSQLGGLFHRTLIRSFNAPTEAIADLLNRGADPQWLPPNGISVLEHAIMRYWNPDAIDLIAGRVKPRHAFWISAGLGDVRTFRSFFNRDGSLKAAAYANRPDMPAMFQNAYPPTPEPTDGDILHEAFYMAGLNSRFDVLDECFRRGLHVDAAPMGMSLLQFAAGNLKVPLVEFLLSRGADPTRNGHSGASPREFAAQMNGRNAKGAELRRICELLDV